MQFQVCAQCGKQFKVYPSEEGRARFCSKQCMGDERRGKPMPWKAGMSQGYRFPNINNYRTDGAISFIAMRNGIETVIDTADLPLLQQFRWTPVYHKAIDHWYALTAIYRPEIGKPRNQYLHRFLLDAPKGMVVDHINHNSLDNRRCNLRLCTNSENMYNRKDCDPRSRTGIQGVSIQTHPDGRQYYLARLTVTKLFPLTDEGLQHAATFVDTARKALCLDAFIRPALG